MGHLPDLVVLYHQLDLSGRPEVQLDQWPLLAQLYPERLVRQLDLCNQSGLDYLLGL